MTVEIRDPRLRAVIGVDDAMERVATGFAFTEGPVWHPRHNYLVFSDIPNARMYRWFPDGRLEVYRAASNKANGNTLDHQGRLLTCEHATSRVVREEAGGTLAVLASHYKGQQLNSPNDIVVRKDGAVFFTDPSFGRMEFYGVPREQELSFRGVFRIDPGKTEPVLLADDFDQPNGLILSADQRRLFVNDTRRRHIRVFNVTDKGDLDKGTVWAETVGEGNGNPDGMKIDSQGNLYCTGPGGIHIFEPGGKCLGVIHPPEHCANFTWGGEDLRTLFVTASTSVYSRRVAIPGPPLF